jgi:hypothetical protein
VWRVGLGSGRLPAMVGERVEVESSDVGGRGITEFSDVGGRSLTESVVFRRDPVRFRRGRRAEIIAVAVVPGALIVSLCVSPWPAWPFGLGLLFVGGLGLIAAVKLRWNAEPPTLTIDPRGITYQDRNIGITFKDRSLDRQLIWADIESIQINGLGETDAADATGVDIRAGDAKPGIAFQPWELGVKELELAEALVRFAPERLRSALEPPPPAGAGKGSRWAFLAVLLPLCCAVLAWVFASQAVDGYQATHHGIPGIAVVTKVDRGSGEDAGSVSVTGDFTPSNGGPVLRHVSIETRTGYVGENVRVNAPGPDATAVYPPDSWDWIGSIVAASVFGAIAAAMLLLLSVSLISSHRNRPCAAPN